MDLRTFLKRSSHFSLPLHTDEFASHWIQTHVRKGASLATQGQPDGDEFILLDGCMSSHICDQEGKEVCVGLYLGPCVITPTIARTRNGLSLVSVEAKTDVKIAKIDARKLSDLMLASEPIRNWANAVLRDALNEKAEREWCLAALGGAERLKWFRQTYPRYEEIFTHVLIASFLGITPVTLSRLRADDGQG